MQTTKTLFETKDGKLFIGGKEVLKGWESFTGWFWFGVEVDRTQDSVINGQVHKKDKIVGGIVRPMKPLVPGGITFSASCGVDISTIWL